MHTADELCLIGQRRTHVYAPACKQTHTWTEHKAINVIRRHKCESTGREKKQTFFLASPEGISSTGREQALNKMLELQPEFKMKML